MSTESTQTSVTSPLHEAVKRQDLTETKRLLSINADVNCLNEFRKTPLYFAYTGDMVTLLLSQKAYLNNKDDEGMSPLHYTSRFNDSSAVRALVDAKADVNAIDNNENTPLHCSALDITRISILIASKANVNARNKDGNTALHIAARQNYVDIVELLLSEKADAFASYDSLLQIECIDPLYPRHEQLRALFKSAMTKKSAVTIFTGFFKVRTIAGQHPRPLSPVLNKVTKTSHFDIQLIPEILRFSGIIPPGKSDMKQAYLHESKATSSIEQEPLETWQILHGLLGSKTAIERHYQILWEKLKRFPGSAHDISLANVLASLGQDPFFLKSYFPLAVVYPDGVLAAALAEDNHYLARLALHHGANINGENNQFRLSAIIKAAAMGYSAIIDAIMTSSQVFTLTPQNYIAAVSAAVSNGHQAAVAILLRSEVAIIFYSNFRAETLITTAKDKGYKNIVTLLEQYRKSRALHFKLKALEVRAKSLEYSGKIAAHGTFAQKPEESLIRLRASLGDLFQSIECLEQTLIGSRPRIYLTLNDHTLEHKIALRNRFETFFERTYPKTLPEYRPHADVTVNGEKLFIEGISLRDLRELMSPAILQQSRPMI